MLLVSMGTQPLPCERIINTIIDSGIKDDIVIQSYYTNESNKKIPFNIKIINFISYEEMENYINKAEIIVTSGTGNIFRSLKLGKKVIIFPRLGKYKEAADNHGLNMKILEKEGYASFVENERDFVKIYKECKNKHYKKFVSNTNIFIENLTEALENI